MIVLTFLVSPVDEIDMIRYEAESEAMKFQMQIYQDQLKAITHHKIKLTSIEMSELSHNTKGILMKSSGRVYDAAYQNSNRDSDELLISTQLDNSSLYNTSKSI